MRIGRRLTSVVVAVVLVVMSAVAVAATGAGGGADAGGGAGRAAARASSLVTAPIGLTRADTVRLNALNTGTAPVEVRAAVLGGAGVLVSKSWTLAPGASGSVDLSGARRGLAFDRRGRAEVRGVLTAPDGGSLAGSVEVFGRAGGSTRAAIPADLPGPMPQVVQVTAPVGVRKGEVARLAVVNLAATASTVRLGIGRRSAAVSASLRLGPGQIGRVDLNPVAEGLALDRSGRVEVRGTVACLGRACDYLSSLQVYPLDTAITGSVVVGITPIQLPEPM